MRYETIDDSILTELREKKRRFLEKNLGSPTKTNLSGVQYDYNWGENTDTHDPRSMSNRDNNNVLCREIVQYLRKKHERYIEK